MMLLERLFTSLATPDSYKNRVYFKVDSGNLINYVIKDEILVLSRKQNISLWKTSYAKRI